MKKRKGRLQRKFGFKKPLVATGVDFIDEEMEWLRLSPIQRILETTKLWKLYIALGGNLDPKPDPQSPFYSPEVPR